MLHTFGVQVLLNPRKCSQAVASEPKQNPRRVVAGQLLQVGIASQRCSSGVLRFSEVGLLWGPK